MLATRHFHACGLASRRQVSVFSVKQGSTPASSPKKAAPAPAPAPAPKAAKASAKPKALRAPSAYNLFYKAMYPVVKKENAGKTLGLTDASKIIRERWGKASPETKAPYEREAAELKAAVDAKKAVALAEKKAKAKPLTAYMAFANENRAAVMAENPGKKVTEIASLLGKRWKELPAAQQQKYKDEAKRQLDEWKARNGTSA